MVKNLKIKKPCQEELKKWLKTWESMDNYRNQEKALNKLIHETYQKKYRYERHSY